jgi:hypothetical protein
MKYLLGIFFVVASLFHGRNLWRWVQEGESDILMSANGDGVFGRRTKRADEPFHFWFHIALNALIIAAFAVFGFWILFGPTDF